MRFVILRKLLGQHLGIFGKIEKVFVSDDTVKKRFSFVTFSQEEEAERLLVMESMTIKNDRKKRTIKIGRMVGSNVDKDA